MSEPEAKHSVVLRSLGGNSLDGVMACWIQLAENSDAQLEVIHEGAFSADGVDGMIASEIDIAPMVREYFPSEFARLNDQSGEAPRLVPVATGSFANTGKTHAIAVFVNASNPLREISLQQLADIFAEADGGTDTHPHATWGDLGLEGDWANADIHTYGMINVRDSGNPPGIVNFMQTVAFGGRRMRSHVKQLEGKTGRHPLMEITEAVAKDAQGIGYSGFGFAVPGTRALKIASKDGARPVPGSLESVSDRTYPLTRTIYLAVRPNLEDRTNAVAIHFLRIALSEAGQACLRKDDAGFLPLGLEARERALSTISNNEEELEDQDAHQ
jgi:phosphate transport system substrate-binding protein